MPSLVDLAASRIAEATAPQSQQTAVKWRWGTVEAVNADGTMDVDIAGSTVPSVTALASATSAAAGDRVRVDYLGTDAVVTGVAANGILATVPEIQSGSYAIPAGSGISGTGYKDYRIYFDTAFQATPQVVAVLSGGSTAGEMGKITLGVPTVSKTYFDARLWASDVATARNPAIRWIGVNGDATASGGGGGGGGTDDYNALRNKPSLEGTTLQGDLMLPDVNVHALTNTQIEAIFD